MPVEHHEERARRTACGAALTAALAVLLSVIHLLIRPPCPRGYVRLLDLPALLPEVSGLVALVAVTTWLSLRRSRVGATRGRTVLATLLWAIGGLLALASLVLISKDFHAGPSAGCWTF